MRWALAHMIEETARHAEPRRHPP
nr:hypothetical protein [Streptomyces sp. MUSC 14]